VATQATVDKVCGLFGPLDDPDIGTNINDVLCTKVDALGDPEHIYVTTVEVDTEDIEDAIYDLCDKIGYDPDDDLFDKLCRIEDSVDIGF
jgi:hypothetical protein